MSDTVRAERTIVLHPNDTEPVAFIFEDAIPESATLSSPSVDSVSPSDELAFTGVQVNTSAFNDRPNNQGEEVPIGKAVLATPGSQVAGTQYEVTVSATLSTGGVKAGCWTVLCEDC